MVSEIDHKPMGGVSYEEMRSEFLSMDQEIKDKSTEVERLKRALRIAEEKLSEREDASAKMIDQMEELHENLAELDVRFERSEDHNRQLREEKEELTKDMEKELTSVKSNLVTTERRYSSKVDELSTEIKMIRKQKDYVIKEKLEQIEKLNSEKTTTENQLNETKENLTRVNTEYDEFKTEANTKQNTLRSDFKYSIENAVEPLSTYLGKNKGSKSPMKKTKGYRILKYVENDLRTILATTTNNNIST